MTEGSNGDALARIVATASTQLDLLADARRRPEIDRAGLAQTALDLLLESIAREAAAAGGELVGFAERFEADKARGLDVRRHLIALGADWSCRHCKNDVVRAVILTLADDVWKPQLVCRACGRTSPLAPRGIAALKKRFGARLEDPAWDPTENGFEVSS